VLHFVDWDFFAVMFPESLAPQGLEHIFFAKLVLLVVVVFTAVAPWLVSPGKNLRQVPSLTKRRWLAPCGVLLVVPLVTPFLVEQDVDGWPPGGVAGRFGSGHHRS
jgi:hypothetical protein